ncbi:unnamed protein product [Sphenostylis stenocarpa]|uniref:Uncharacterized protein n=1 Tax=Sphenostylis stenocarpa TaxID=92480 RepID=A0AA86VM08_9FABA|nr:unnamed protein product [Sphenostylis stenocarpa]
MTSAFPTPQRHHEVLIASRSPHFTASHRGSHPYHEPYTMRPPLPPREASQALTLVLWLPGSMSATYGGLARLLVMIHLCLATFGLSPRKEVKLIFTLFSLLIGRYMILFIHA